ncbi:ABC transporter ATP-binding protein [Austwickia chelonae]|uniref:ABC transporter ATP-binding protein n=1 Tax=Austwickia chelonae TaxID=100225 RepID=UPI000E2441C4|nr:ABC transporter ATP-binding protein [Austwickia chelonae]
MTLEDELSLDVEPSERGEARTPAACFRGVTKCYSATKALDGLDLVIPAGSIVALLGPNGAGKSTMLEILTGLRLRDAGEVEVLGLDPGRDRRRLAERLGVQVQEFNLQPTVRVEESLRFFASLYRKPLDVDYLLRKFGLEEKRKSPFPTLSGGQKRRLAIARALVGNPELVVLDEPTSGLDPQGQEFLRRETRALAREGRTVLLSTHDVADAQLLADTVIVIDAGRAVAAGAPRQIIAEQCQGWRVEITGSIPAGMADGREHRIVEEGEVTVVYGPDRASVTAGLQGVQVLSEREPTLQDAYFLLTGASLRA